MNNLLIFSFLKILEIERTAGDQRRYAAGCGRVQGAVDGQQVASSPATTTTTRQTDAVAMARKGNGNANASASTVGARARNWPSQRETSRPDQETPAGTALQQQGDSITPSARLFFFFLSPSSPGSIEFADTAPT